MTWKDEPQLLEHTTGHSYTLRTEQDEICNNCGLKAHNVATCPW